MLVNILNNTSSSLIAFAQAANSGSWAFSQVIGSGSLMP